MKDDSWEVEIKWPVLDEREMPRGMEVECSFRARGSEM